MEPVYKCIVHQERPFVLHLAYKIPTDEIVKKLNKYKTKTKAIDADFFEKENPSSAALTYDLHDYLYGHIIIVFQDIPNTRDIIHEVVHCVSKHFRYIRLPLDESSEESYAYMADWMVYVIFKFLKKPL